MIMIERDRCHSKWNTVEHRYVNNMYSFDSYAEVVWLIGDEFESYWSTFIFF